MSAAIVWCIPPSTRRWMESVPSDRPVCVLMRHSVRPYLPPGEAGYALPVTEEGGRLARELGRSMGGRLRSLRASPLLRCVQTARALGEGAGREERVFEDRLLGDPGVYVYDGRSAGKVWRQLGHEAVMDRLVAGDEVLPGLAAADPAARLLVLHMLAAAAGRTGLHVFVTHDSLVTATAARLLDVPLRKQDWPWYLEAAFFWEEGGEVRAAYRDRCRGIPANSLGRLDDANVTGLAQREVARTVGLDSAARFFLAGGAFKTLLTGRPPRDLALWAPSEPDRRLLVGTLEARGALPLDPRPFADAFEIGDRVVEVPLKTEPATLEGRLGRFDIALSAVGAEHLGDGTWRAVVDPRARVSVERREVLLLKPLVNWKHALGTLERLRRYAEELGFRVPEAEEAEVWRVFGEQPDDMKRGMLERYDRTAQGGHGVREDVLCRLP